MELRKIFRENKVFIFFIVLLVIIYLISKRTYLFYINIFRLSLLYIFVFSIVYSFGARKEISLINLLYSSVVAIIIGIFMISVDIENHIRYLTLSIFVINYAMVVYLLIHKKIKFNRLNLLISYILILIINTIMYSFFSAGSVNFLVAVLNIVLNVLSLYLLIYKTNRKKIYYNVYRNLLLISIFFTIMCMLSVLYDNVQIKLDTSEIVQISLCVYVYIAYLYSIKKKIFHPYSELYITNEKLAKNKNKLDGLNLAIEKDIYIQEKLKDYIDQRKEVLMQALDTVPDAWAIMDYSFNCNYKNSKYKECFDKDKENEDKLKLVLNEIKIDFDKKNSRINIVDEKIKFGEKIYLLSVNHNDKENNYLISLNDVTQEIIMNRKIRELNEDYEKVVLNIPCPIMVRSTEGKGRNVIISVNRSFEKSHEISADDFCQMKLDEYIENFNIDLFDNRSFKRVGLRSFDKFDMFNSNSSSNGIINYSMIDRNGDERIEEVRVCDYHLKNKLHKLLIFRNITSEINLLRNINRQKTVYQNLLKVIPEAIFLENISTSKVIFANRAFNQLFHIEKDNLGQKTRGYRNILIKKYINNLKLNKKDSSIYLVNEKKQIKEVELISRKLYFDQKECKVRIVRDLGNQRELERLKSELAKQRKYDTMKMEFFANISHELKTPLNNIYSSAQLVEKMYKDGKIKEKQSVLGEHIKITKQNMFRLMRLTDNIINISQVKSELYKVKAVNFDINILTEGIITSINSYAKSKNINLVFDTNEESIVVGLDPESIERIVLNLISNAIKFTPSGGKILVGVYKKSKNVELMVEDNGVGIEEEKLKDIFDRFKQIENSSISNEFGSGIGLYLTKSLVEIQCGKIDIFSEVNRGTKVVVDFPILRVKEETVGENEYNKKIDKFEIEFFDIYKEC